MSQTKLEGTCTTIATSKEPDPWVSDSIELFQKLFRSKYGRPPTSEDVDDYINWGGRP